MREARRASIWIRHHEIPAERRKANFAYRKAASHPWLNWINCGLGVITDQFGLSPAMSSRTRSRNAYVKAIRSRDIRLLGRPLVILGGMPLGDEPDHGASHAQVENGHVVDGGDGEDPDAIRRSEERRVGKE